MTRRLLYQYHLLPPFFNVVPPSEGEYRPIRHALCHCLVEAPAFHWGATHLLVSEPFNLFSTESPGAGKEEANLTRPSFPKDGGKNPQHLRAMCRCTCSARHGNRSHLFMLEEN